MKLNEIAKAIEGKRLDKKQESLQWAQFLYLKSLAQMTSRATSHPGSKRGYVHPVRGTGNASRAVTRTRRSQPWAFREGKTNKTSGPRDH